MRLAMILGYRTLAEMDETMTASEYVLWRRFHELYDLPDAYNTTANICVLVSRSLGGKGRLTDYVQFHKPDVDGGVGGGGNGSNLAAAQAFLRSYAKRPQKS